MVFKPTDTRLLRSEHGLYEAVIEALEEGVILFDREGTAVACNPAAETILGLELRQQHLLPNLAWRVVDENLQAFVASNYPVTQSFASGQPEKAVLGAYLRSGELRWLRVNAQPIFEGTEVAFVSVSFTDITEERETKRRLERETLFRQSLINLVTESLTEGLDERFYQRLLECAVGSIPSAQAGSLLLLDGERFKFVAAVNYDLAILQTVYLLPEEMYQEDEGKKLLLVYGFDNGDVPKERREIIGKAGRAGDIKVCMSIPVVIDGGAVAYFNLDNFESPTAYDEEDMTIGRIFAQHAGALWQRFKLERRLEHLAFYDALTGLPNRALLYERLGQALRSRHHKHALAVMILDLDNFKDVNDAFGHDAGDELLCRVSERLGNVLRQGDTLARWGGDEFVLLTELARPEAAAQVAAKVLGALKESFIINSGEVRVRGSLGIEVVAAPAHTLSVDEAIKRADIALYQAKGAGRNTYRQFSAEMAQHIQTQVTLESDLQTALGQKAFELDFQPRFDLRTSMVTSVEALVRWRHPVYGLISPSVFIPLAEANGSIVALGELVLELALRQAQAWKQLGVPWRVSVNVSAKQLMFPGFVEVVRSCLNANRVEPDALELEVTESAAVFDMDTTIRDLQNLRNMGVRVALDDFGTGYSSLTHLRRLPLDTLKLDQAFVRDLGGGQDEAVEIVRAIVSLGRSLGLTVVAEGVESERQLGELRALGCHEVQGYYLSYPRPAAELSELHKQGSLMSPLASFFDSLN